MEKVLIKNPVSTRVFIEKEIKNKAKKKAVDLGLTFKEFLNLALLEKATENN